MNAKRPRPHEVVAARDEGAVAVALNLAEIESLIAGTIFAGQIHHHPTTPSTNALGLEAAQQGVSTGVWVADQQTAGRGRGGHSWHSPAFVDGHPAGLYVSILVRPRLFGAAALKLSLAAGLAAKAAIAQAAGVDIDLRWPNDLMLAGPVGEIDVVEKKLGGILTESAMEGGQNAALAYAVIGIGINLNQTAFPPELAALATSLRIALGNAVSRESILAALLRALESEITLVEAEASGTRPHNSPSLAVRFERASSWVRNLRVHVDEDGGYTGLTEGLNSLGLLQIRLDNATLRTVRHGGVRRTPTTNNQ